MNSEIGTSEINASISLCMIVKDEEENLTRCLDSARDFVDEIIIVDTGSTDRTVEIAESYGARVFNHPWEGSFSKARNYSLKYATCDWILILDADHELEKADAHRLKEATNTTDANYIHFPVYDIHEGGKNLGVYDFGLLFRNHLGFHYKGTVHNELVFSGNVKRFNIRVYHYGSDLNEEQMRKKFIRTSALLKEQIKAEPHNPVPHRYLGDAYMRMKIYDEAIAESNTALTLRDESKCRTENFMISYYIICAAYYEKEDMESAKIYALRAIEIDDQQIDIYCILALVYFNIKEFDKFLQCSKRYLDLWNNLMSNNNNIVNPFVYHTIGHKWKIHLLCGLHYLSIGQDETGNSEIETAMKESTDIENCLTLLGNFYMKNNNVEKAEKVFEKLLDINEESVNALFNLGQTHFRQNNMEGTMSFWRKAVEIAPDAFDIRLLICTINIAQGNLEEVVTDCDQLLQVLNMPRDVTIDSLTDLTNLFDSISEELKIRNDIQSAEIASRICKNL
jgi:glycosyltransferase involved in cell wall biosynthesis